MILSIVCVYCDVWGLYSGEYISQLGQGQASCAFNLSTCRCTEMGQMGLEGTYCREGEGFPSAFWVCNPTQNVQGK